MNLVLVFIVAVVAGAGADVGEGLALDLDDVDKLLARDAAVAVGVEQAHELVDDLVLPLLGHEPVGLVHQAVGAQDLARRPDPVVVKVVQGEEGGGVKGGGVVLL